MLWMLSRQVFGMIYKCGKIQKFGGMTDDNEINGLKELSQQLVGLSLSKKRRLFILIKNKQWLLKHY